MVKECCGVSRRKEIDRASNRVRIVAGHQFCGFKNQNLTDRMGLMNSLGSGLFLRNENDMMRAGLAAPGTFAPHGESVLKNDGEKVAGHFAQTLGTYKCTHGLICT